MPGAGSAQGPRAERCGMFDRDFRNARGVPITRPRTESAARV
jgi:hypothetical protein